MFTGIITVPYVVRDSGEVLASTSDGKFAVSDSHSTPALLNHSGTRSKSDYKKHAAKFKDEA